MKSKKKLKLIAVLLLVVISLVIAIVMLPKLGNDKSVIDSDLYSDDVKDFSISTTYGDVYFPEEWKNIMKTSVITDGDKEIVEFRACLEGKEEIHVFDLVFGGDKFELGQIVDGDKKTAVSINSYLYELDDTWTDEEKMTLSTIEFDINYLINNLEKIDGFEKW